MRTIIGKFADLVHYILLRPLYGDAYPAAKIRWHGGKDFRREGGFGPNVRCPLPESHGTWTGATVSYHPSPYRASPNSRGAST